MICNDNESEKRVGTSEAQETKAQRCAVIREARTISHRTIPSISRDGKPTEALLVPKSPDVGTEKEFF